MELTGRTLAITGIGGFIGMRAAERAVARGVRVRGLERAPAAAARAAKVADVTVGDVCDVEAVRALVSGADAVLHTAAIVEEDGDPIAFTAVNVDAPCRLARAAQEAGVRVLVHLSSVMVYGFSFPVGVSEEGPLRGDGNVYCESKIAGERALGRIVDPSVTRLVVVRPGDVYGPGSVPWVLRPFRLIRRRLFALPDGGRGLVNHVHVDNLVDAILASIEREVRGPFNVTDGAAATCRSYFGRFAGWLGRDLPSLPAGLMRRAFGGLAWAARHVDVRPPAYPAAVDYLLRPNVYGIERARRELGYSPAIDLDEGMRGVRAWLEDTGELRAAGDRRAS